VPKDYPTAENTSWTDVADVGMKPLTIGVEPPFLRIGIDRVRIDGGNQPDSFEGTVLPRWTEALATLRRNGDTCLLPFLYADDADEAFRAMLQEGRLVLRAVVVDRDNSAVVVREYPEVFGEYDRRQFEAEVERLRASAVQPAVAADGASPRR